MLDSVVSQYINNLPEVDTARLPKGTLFYAQGFIYQVIETSAGGYHRARVWRQPESTDVALVPGSFLSSYLPLIKRARVLPIYRSRVELALETGPSCFVFPIENLALDSAYLDVALIQSSGAFVRNQGREPAFAVTDGVHVFRLYYYRNTIHRRPTDLTYLQNRPLTYKPQPHTEGPLHWRLLPGWTEVLPSLDVTQQSLPVVRFSNNLDDTIPNTPIQRPEE